MQRGLQPAPAVVEDHETRLTLLGTDYGLFNYGEDADHVIEAAHENETKDSLCLVVTVGL